MLATVVKKELRGYFNSAIAVIFLAAFVAVAMYTFFWREKFFARGIADLRPLFEWMPRLLIILVSALAMRLWSDERRAGTPFAALRRGGRLLCGFLGALSETGRSDKTNLGSASTGSGAMRTSQRTCP